MRYIIILLSLFLFTHCSKDEHSFGLSSAKTSMQKSKMSKEEAEMGRRMDMDQTAPQSIESPSPPRANQEVSKIIKSGNLNFDVEDLSEAKKKVDQYLQSVDGYYEDESYSSSQYRNSHSLTIRVPSSHFDSLVYLLEYGTGKLESKNISAQDVSEEYVDLQIRLKNNLAYLDQYKEILKKAKTIKEILNVQERIRNLETEIESKKGRIQFLNNRVSYGTLHVQIYQKVEFLDDSRSFTSRIGKAFKNGYALFLSFLVTLVSLWPFIILLVGFTVFRKRIFALFKRTKSS